MKRNCCFSAPAAPSWSVKEFAPRSRKDGSSYRTDFTIRPPYTKESPAVWTCALAAAQAKSLDAVKMAKAMQGFKLPPEVSLMPDGAFFREGQNQLIPNLYVGNAQANGSDPEDLFNVTEVVKGVDIAGTLEDTGCKMTWPA